ncbi:MAG: hypothetical protein U1F06_00105 [Steroidobacteraceae bacterium]
MAASTGSCAPASAAASSFSRRSVIPLTAECTMSTRRPSASRSRTTLAMLRQFCRRKRWCRRT